MSIKSSISTELPFTPGFNHAVIKVILAGSVIHGLSLSVFGSDLINIVTGLHVWQLVIGLLLPYIILYIAFVSSPTLSLSNGSDQFLDLVKCNPDIMFIADASGTIEYANPSAIALCQTLNPNGNPVEILLPVNFQSIIASARGNQTRKLGLEHHIDKVIFDYSIFLPKHNNRILISGRDISERRAMETRLFDSQNILRDMSELVNKIFTDYDPLNFDLQTHFSEMVSIILHSKHDIKSKRPTHILLSLQSNQEHFVGRLYQIGNQEIIYSNESFSINQDQLNTLSYMENELFFATSEQETTPELINKLFGSNIEKHLTETQGLAVFRSGKVAVAAFYEEQSISIFDSMLLKALAIYGNALLQISLESKSTDEAFLGVLDTLARASEISGVEMGSHNKRLNEYSRALAIQMNLPKEFIQSISYSAQLHDIGQIQVPNSILTKQTTLSEEEHKTIQKHCLAGSHILGDSTRLKMASDIAKYHHERHDGSGYPYGLAGEDIPIAARIVAVADVYDALRQHKAYKPSVTHNEAIHILTHGDEKTKPRQFDPTVLEALIGVQDKFDEIFNRLQS